MKSKLDAAIRIIKTARDPERGAEAASANLQVWSLGLERISDKEKNRLARRYELKL